MKNIKTFENFRNKDVKIEEMEEGSKSLTMTKQGESLKIGENTIPMKRTKHIQSAFNQDNKATFEADIFLVDYPHFAQAIKKNGHTLKVLDNSGKTLLDGEGQGLTIVLYTPKGYNGEISLKTKAHYVGKKSGTTRVTGMGDKAWGVFDANLLKGLTEQKPLKANKSVISKTSSPVKIVVKNPYEYDNFSLTNEAKEKIKSELSKISDKNTRLVFKTGASLDADPKEEGVKEINGEKVSRQEWDYYLTKNRYKTAADYIKSLGFNNLGSVSLPKSSEDFDKIYGKFDSNDKKNEINRNLVIKSK